VLDKGELSLCSVKNYAVKNDGVTEVELHAFSTSQYAKVSGQLHVQPVLAPGQKTPVPTEYETGWAPEPVWTLWRTYMSMPEIEPRLHGRPA
jgi:hypothetical protein